MRTAHIFARNTKSNHWLQQQATNSAQNLKIKSKIDKKPSNRKKKQNSRRNNAIVIELHIASVFFISMV